MKFRAYEWLAACIAIAVGTGIAAVTADWSDAGVAVLVTAAILLLAIVASYRWLRDPLSPLMLVLLTFFILYVLRPGFILSTRMFGPTTKRAEIALGLDAQEAMVSALGLVVLGLFGLLLGFVAWIQLSRGGAEVSPDTVRVRSSAVQERSWAVVGLVILGLLVAGWAYFTLIASVGGIGAYVEALSQRSGFFFGRGYLNLAALPLKVVTLLLFCHAISADRVSGFRKALIGALIVAVLIGDFLSGGRAAILTGTMVPLVVIYHYVRQRLSLVALGALAVVALLMFVSVRVITRDAVYAGESKGSSDAAALTLEAFKNLPETTVGGQEAIPFDSLLVLRLQAERGLDIQYGATYLPIFTFPIPRSIWENKPLGGGNAWFTQTFFPRFFGPQKTETSISMIGEAYANFGRVGVPIVLFLFGMGLGIARWSLGRVTTPRGMVTYAVTVGYSINIVRGDAFQSVTRYALTVGLVWTFALLMQQRSRFVGAQPAVGRSAAVELSGRQLPSSS
ncbi:MAG: oligosaccharide repeat unit polymerase [Thermoleophilaceae bacterium]|nr:oligosaccharide repeat unit polymerase [Thermoleophilaceae bacterium]